MSGLRSKLKGEAQQRGDAGIEAFS